MSRKIADQVGQAQRGAEFQRQRHQVIGALAMLVRGVRQAHVFQQAAELRRQDGDFGGQVWLEKVRVGVVQEHGYASYFAKQHHRRRHERAGAKFARHGILLRIEMVDVASLPPPNCVGSHSSFT